MSLTVGVTAGAVFRWQLLRVRHVAVGVTGWPDVRPARLTTAFSVRRLPGGDRTRAAWSRSLARVKTCRV